MQRCTLQRAAWFLATLAGMLASGAALAQQGGGCGELANGYGPYDYRKDKDKLPIVDGHHFTPPVESLVRGISGPIGGELDYVLRAFPNHHRALVALTRFTERLKTPQPPGATYPVECYFVRALRFAQDDNVVRMLYAQYLGKQRRNPDAVKQLELAAAQAGENGFTHYNIGLVYAELGQMDRALAQSHRATALGFERPELRKALERAGKWQEPPNRPPASPPEPVKAESAASAATMQPATTPDAAPQGASK